MTTEALGAALPVWSALPFAGVLLSIALFPLVAPRFWHHRYPRVSVFWAALFAVPFLWVWRETALEQITHILVEDYVPFLILLAALFAVTGGIHIRGSLRGTPATNSAILASGTLLASVIGTTGASMILIRPLLRANANRKRRVHTFVFFIFLVANVGGVLTPLGDPPLFLGFLKGVPFFWTLALLPEMLFVGGTLLVIHHLLDRRAWRREHPRADARGLEMPPASPNEAIGSAPRVPFGIDGGVNILLLAGVLGGVLLSGFWNPGSIPFAGMHLGIQDLARDGLLLLIGLASLVVTPAGVRAANSFSWAPIREVAWLFLGIFVTIIPALAMLQAGDAGPLGVITRSVRTPGEYFWATGILSSFLDNAPTYLAFLTGALGRYAPGLSGPEAVHALIETHPGVLAGISCGAVFMGANTYIGNAPNFMVRSIAEEAGIAMPSFFGYIVRWTIPFLVPLLLAATVLFR